MMVIDEFRRQVLITGVFRDRRIDFEDIECLRISRNFLLDNLPNPIGVIIPVYETVLVIRGGREVRADGGPSRAQLWSQAAELCRRLNIPLCEWRED